MNFEKWENTIQRMKDIITDGPRGIMASALSVKLIEEATTNMTAHQIHNLWACAKNMLLKHGRITQKQARYIERRI